MDIHYNNILNTEMQKQNELKQICQLNDFRDSSQGFLYPL